MRINYKVDATSGFIALETLPCAEMWRFLLSAAIQAQALLCLTVPQGFAGVTQSDLMHFLRVHLIGDFMVA